MTAANLTIPTHCAHWGWDDHRYFGHSVFEELTGHESMSGMSALSVLGRRLPKEHCDVLDDIVCTSTLADPRIWPLKVSRLVAAYGSSNPGVVAGLATLQGARIGPFTTTATAQALVELREAMGGREDNPDAVLAVVTAYLEQHERIGGFGTPFRPQDERMIAFSKCMSIRGRTHLPNWRAMEAIIIAMRRLRRPAPNVGLGMAAAMLDIGLTPAEIGPLATVLLQHMFIANAVESAARPSAILRELPHGSIEYVGVPARKSPRLDVHTSFLRVREPPTDVPATGT